MKLGYLAAIFVGVISEWLIATTPGLPIVPLIGDTDQWLVRVLGQTAILVLVGAYIALDTSHQRTLFLDTRRELIEYRSLLDALPVGLYRIGADGKILEANRKFAEILGYDETKRLKGVNFNDFFANKLERAEHIAKLRDASVFAEFELRRKDGRTVWVRDYPKATLDNLGSIEEVAGVLVETHGIDAIMRDMTEHKRLESMKNHFISAVMHELRTPLASITGYVDYFLAKETDLIPESVKNGLDVIKRNADRLSELTESLLNVQRMESGVIDLLSETFSLNETVTQCIEEMAPLAQLKNQHISTNAPPTPINASGNRLRLQGAIISLLDNAIKYTPANGTIKVHLDEDEKNVRVEVTDTGIGIDRKDLKHVFEPFATIEKSTYYRGTGVGLSLARRVIEAHGGRILASSEGKGLGSTFTLILPRKREQVVGVYG